MDDVILEQSLAKILPWLRSYLGQPQTSLNLCPYLPGQVPVVLVPGGVREGGDVPLVVPAPALPRPLPRHAHITALCGPHWSSRDI